MPEPTAILLGVGTLVFALAVATFVVPGIECDGPLGLLLAALLYEALSLGIWYAVGPSLAVALGPLGLVGGLLLSLALLWLVGQVVPGYAVDGLGSALFGALVIGVAQFAAGLFFSLAALGSLIDPA